MSKNTGLIEKVEKRLKDIKFKTPQQAKSPKVLEKSIKDVLQDKPKVKPKVEPKKVEPKKKNISKKDVVKRVAKLIN